MKQLIILLSLILFLGIYSCNQERGETTNENNTKDAIIDSIKIEEQKLLELRKEKAQKDSLLQDSINREKRHEEIKREIFNQMVKVINIRKKNVEKEQQDFGMGSSIDKLGNYYFTTDLNSDGIPELWIVTGTCAAYSNLGIYYADYENKKLKNIGPGEDTGGGWNCSFYKGQNYIIEDYCHQYEEISKVTLSNGKLKYKIIYSRTFDGEEKGNYKINEPEVNSSSIYDLSLLEQSFNFIK